MTVLEVFAAVVEEDDAAGAALIDAVVYDYLADEAETVRKDLSTVVSLVGLDRVQVAKRELGRSYVEMIVSGEYPDDGFQKAAEYLAGIEGYITKAFGLENWFYSRTNSHEQREVNRDARGRFTRGIRGGAAPVAAVQNAKFKNPKTKAALTSSTYKDKLVDDEGANTNAGNMFGRAHNQYVQANIVANEFKQALGNKADPKDVVVEMLYMRSNDEGAMSGEPFTRTFRLSDLEGGKIPDSVAPDLTEQLVAMSIAPGRGASEDTVRAVGAYNALGEYGGEALASLAGIDSDRLNSLKTSLGVDAHPNQTRLGRFFDRLGAGGQVLSQVTGQEKLGSAVAFMGVLGPQAEQVLGPYVQRTAYRYRGTETRPDSELLQAFRSPDMAEIDEAAEDPLNAPGIERPTTTVQRVAHVAAKDKVFIPGRGRNSDALEVQGMRLRDDSLRMQVRADVAGATLVSTLPRDPILARLSEASGQILPSQGILIDRNGDVVSQAVGFSDDHYLPFDLRNLGQLRGGQYVRTRQQGGLTGEDIYAAVTMGARQVQVVSTSGVYTLEMAPDFRGARGNSDKARSMYDRYLKILDAVENSGLYLQDIPATKRAEIQQQVAGLGFKGKQATDEINRRIEAAREADRVVQPEEAKQLKAAVMADMGYKADEKLTGMAAREFDEAFAERLDAFRASKTNRLRLNGEGYMVALQTLQQQFPYFIKRAEYRTLKDFAAVTGAKTPKGMQFAEDAGYARPGAIRAKGIRGGFYRTGSAQLAPKQRTDPEAVEEQAAAAAATATKTPDAAAAPAAEGDKPKADAGGKPTPPAAQVALSARLAGKMPTIQRKVEDAQKELFEQISTMDVENPKNASLSFERALTLDAPGFISWMFSQNADVLTEVMTPSNRDALLKSAARLSDEKAVMAAFDKVVNTGASSNDFFASGGKIGPDTPEGDRTASAKWVSDKAQTIADGMLMVAGPFIAGGVGVWNGAAQGDTTAPQALPGIENIANGKQLLDYVEEDPKAGEAMRRVLLKPDRSYRSIAEINRAAAADLKRFKAVQDAKVKMGAANDPDEIIDAAPDIEELRTALKNAVLDDDYSDADFPDVKTDEGKAALQGLVLNFPAEEEAAVLQKGWSLAVTMRLVNALEDGDVVPKGLDGQLVKSAGRRFPVLGQDHPLARRAAERVAKGLHPVGAPRRPR